MNTVIGTNIGIKLINGKIKPKKRSFKTSIVLTIFTLLLIIFSVAFLYGIINMNIEYIFFCGLTVWGITYLLLISAYTQNSNNYYIKVKAENSFEGFELYYKQRKVELKFDVDENLDGPMINLNLNVFHILMAQIWAILQNTG